MDSLFGSPTRNMVFFVDGDKCFEHKGFYYSKQAAEKKGEALKSKYGIEEYRVESKEYNGEEGFDLWVH